LAGLLGFRNNRLQSNLAMVLGGLIALSGKIVGIYVDAKIGNFIILLAFMICGVILFPGGKWIRR
jgi:SSS family solute:Na+ symporter